MRWLVLLMLVVNGVLFAYFTLENDKLRVVKAGHDPIQPEKITLLNDEDLKKIPLRDPTQAASDVTTPTPSAGGENNTVSAPIPASSETPSATATTASPPTLAPVPTTACYEWGSFEQSRVAAARAVLNKLKIQYTLKQETSEEAQRYWVYMPKFPTAKAAQAKADELHQMGINDIFVVQEPKWKNAISFGMFKDEVLANKLLTELQFKGINAEKLIRNQEKGQVNLLTAAITADMVSEVEGNRSNFPGSEIKQIVCQ